MTDGDPFAPPVDLAGGAGGDTLEALLRGAVRPKPTSRAQAVLASRAVTAGAVFAIMVAVFLAARPSFVTRLDDKTGLHRVQARLVVVWAAVAAGLAALLPPLVGPLVRTGRAK